MISSKATDQHDLLDISEHIRNSKEIAEEKILPALHSLLVAAPELTDKSSAAKDLSSIKHSALALFFEAQAGEKKLEPFVEKHGSSDDGICLHGTCKAFLRDKMIFYKVSSLLPPQLFDVNGGGNISVFEKDIRAVSSQLAEINGFFQDYYFNLREKTINYLFVYPKAPRLAPNDSDNHSLRKIQNAILFSLPMGDGGISCSIFSATVLANIPESEACTLITVAPGTFNPIPPKTALEAWNLSF